MSEESARRPLPAIASNARLLGDLQQIVDAIPALVFYKDPDLRIRFANRAVEEALRVGRDSLVGTRLAQWIAEEAEAREHLEEEVLQSRRPCLGVTERMKLPVRGARWFEISRFPQVSSEGRLLGLVVLCRDITDSRPMEAQSLQTQKLESLGRLAGGVAHDFNNLLTSFFGLIAAAQRNVAPDSLAHEYLSLMQLAAEGATNITKQLLTFARRQMLEPRVVDLNSVIRDTALLLGRTLGAHITIEISLTTESARARIDPSQVSQLVMNLALNARDAMREGGTLRLRTAHVAADQAGVETLPEPPTGRYVVLEVSDTGDGLSDEAKQHLFEPFFTSKALGQGTGLGLATCYGIVKQSRGHIVAHSEPGCGTRFSVYLPEAIAPVEPRAAPALREPELTGSETVLVAEDDDLVRYLTVAALTSSGYRVLEAMDGEEALSTLRRYEGPIHLLVTDLIMPKMGGVELAEQMRSLRPSTNVLFVTGYAHDAALPCASGARREIDLLHKPFTSEQLLRRVRRALEADRLGPTG